MPLVQLSITVVCSADRSLCYRRLSAGLGWCMPHNTRAMQASLFHQNHHMQHECSKVITMCF